jgi:hypothetical protein
MIRPTAYCDECARPKQNGDTWFRARSLPSPRSFQIQEWGSKTNWPESDEQHLCSEWCAVKAMAKAIGSTSGEQNG